MAAILTTILLHPEAFDHQRCVSTSSFLPPASLMNGGRVSGVDRLEQVIGRCSSYGAEQIRVAASSSFFLQPAAVINVPAVTGKSWVDGLVRDGPMRWDSSWWGRLKKNCCSVDNLQTHSHGCRSAEIHYVPFVTVSDVGRLHRKASPMRSGNRVSSRGPSEDAKKNSREAETENLLPSTASWDGVRAVSCCWRKDRSAKLVWKTNLHPNAGEQRRATISIKHPPPPPPHPPPPPWKSCCDADKATNIIRHFSVPVRFTSNQMFREGWVCSLLFIFATAGLNVFSCENDSQFFSWWRLSGE